MPSTPARLAPNPAPLRAVPTGAGSAGQQAPDGPHAAVRVLVVTWNRKDCARSLIDSLSRQTYPLASMHVTIIDNASTDGTLDHLRERYAPEEIIANDTDTAHEPAFSVIEESPQGNTAGFGSFTIIRNRTNMGGCGGFNTGLAFTEWASLRAASRSGGGAPAGPAYIWLVDDDADVPPDALANLAAAMAASPDIGLVGSRTVNIADRRTTIETTIYYNSETGGMQDDCPPGNAKHQRWRSWVTTTGGTRGNGPDGSPLEFSGTIDVDVVSACSMLARWSAVTGTAGATSSRPAVGFWDWRYFIYCDDADWCLRFAKAGWRVVLNLDAVVFHTPWNLKLTPARIYYANRNRVWMGQKVLEGPNLRRVTRRAMVSFLRDSMNAAWRRRLFHANIILDTARDIAIGRSGKTGSDGPPAEPIIDAMRRLRLLRGDVTVAILANQPESLRWIADVQSRVREGLAALPADQRRGLTEPIWLTIARNDVPGAQESAKTVIYGHGRKSKLKKQMYLLPRSGRPRIAAVVVFDQTSDLPMLLVGGHNLHIDLKKPAVVQVERDGWAARMRFVLRWIPIAARSLVYASRIKPFRSTTRYG